MEELCPDETALNSIPLLNDQSHLIVLLNHKIPRNKVEWFCLKIDLDYPGLSVIAEPSSDTTFSLFSLKEFSLRNKTIAAINTVPFYTENKKSYPSGIVKINGEIISKPVSKYSALGFYHSQGKLRAVICQNQTEPQLEQTNSAFGGFFTILDENNILEYKKIKRPRTAAGISGDGRFLYLFACSSTKKADSKNGLCYEECAAILQKLGCTSAIEFDGGHSTGLTVYDNELVKPAFQRKIPAAMGLKISE